ncbi:hypothetical protein [Halorubrum tebenquichense]|uniref:hypothetical protein n=1 Tax=Halorubrum tebenquichense TaxID=119434 RepID=UPI00126977BE|nr:hypothetical protein [Halorubrum tebenquichense]
MNDLDRDETGGGALVVGYSIVLVAVYRTPASAFETTTGSLGAALYFLVLPAAGILGRIYAYRGGPFGAVPLFVLGSYLGFFGIALSFGALLSAAPVGIPLVGGLLGVLCATLALVTGLLQVTRFLPFRALRVDAD